MKLSRDTLYCAGVPLGAIVADALPSAIPTPGETIPAQHRRAVVDGATSHWFQLSSYASVRTVRNGYARFRWSAGYAALDTWRSMLGIANDSVALQVTCRADQTVLLSLQYGAIIGSRWLAIVPVGEWNAHLARLLGARRQSDSVSDARRILRSAGVPLTRVADYLGAGKRTDACKVPQ